MYHRKKIKLQDVKHSILSSSKFYDIQIAEVAITSISHIDKENLIPLTTHVDHSYNIKDTNCIQCKKRRIIIKNMRAQINMLKCELNDMRNNDNTKNICEQFINTNVLVKQNTGLPNLHAFNALLDYLHPRLAKICNW